MHTPTPLCFYLSEVKNKQSKNYWQSQVLNAQKKRGRQAITFVVIILLNVGFLTIL